jgi:hypothetical protein
MRFFNIGRGVILFGLLASLAGCNWPGLALGSPPTATAVPPTDTAVPATLAPTETSTPTTEPTATLTPTPTLGPPTVAALAKDAVCRFGPSLDWSTEGKLPAGQSVPIQARNDKSTWWYIENPTRQGKFCWVGGDEVEATGDLAGLPVKPVPSAIVTGVSVKLDPKSDDIDCTTDFPFEFDVVYTITTTGPSTVKYDAEGSSESVTFKEAGTKTFEDSFDVDEEGEYSYSVHVTSPNDMTGKGTGEVECEI